MPESDAMADGVREVSGSANDPAAPSFLQSVVLGLDRGVATLCALAMGLAALCLLAAFAMIAYAVVMRYVFGSPPVWVDDTVGFLLVGIVMLAAADALRKGEHIGVDLLTARLRGRALRLTTGWALVSVLLATGFLAWEGWKNAAFNRMLGIMTHGHVEIPVFWIQLLIPIGGLLLLMTALVALARLLAGLPSVMHAEPDREVQQ